MNTPSPFAQRTIRRSQRVRGIGLHTRTSINVTFAPLPDDSGIVFRRTDGATVVDIPVCLENIGSTVLSTNLEYQNCSVSTVEHLMSALAICGIDNLLVEIDGPEVPICDGSAYPWLLVMSACGINLQSATKRYIEVLRPVRTEGGEDRFAAFTPHRGIGYHIEIDFDVEVVRRSNQVMDFEFDPEFYLQQISRARTFCHVRDIEAMTKMDRALGGGLDNAVVYDDYRVLNPEGLRYPDEFVRHKMLDCIGDCYMTGTLILGHYQARRPGHALSNQLLQTLMQEQENWRMIQLPDDAHEGVRFWQLPHQPLPEYAFE